MARISVRHDWDPAYERFLALTPSDQNEVASIYRRIGVERPEEYNHICMVEALVEFSGLKCPVMMDGALEYEEAMAGAELIAGEG